MTETNRMHPMFKPTNALAIARERHRAFLGDATIISNSPIAPIVRSMVTSRSPMIPPMVRKMGENTLEQRARRGNANLWAGTPVQSKFTPPELADIDLTEELSEFDSVGWEWNRHTNKLVAFLTIGQKTYTVKIPAARLLRIFNRSASENGCNDYVKRPTIAGIFSKVGKWFKKAAKSVGKGLKQAITSPVRFVKNPKKFIRDTGRKIKKFVKGVGKVALKVASSPIFAGVMTAISAIPPLTAVGGAGLAAFAAANAIKPAFKAAEAAIDTVDAISKKKKAGDIIGAMTKGISSMPGPANNLMKSALKSVPDDIKKAANTAKRFQGRNTFRLKGGKLTLDMDKLRNKARSDPNALAQYIRTMNA